MFFCVHISLKFVQIWSILTEIKHTAVMQRKQASRNFALVNKNAASCCKKDVILDTKRKGLPRRGRICKQ